MFGERAVELVRELKRALPLSLPMFSEEGLRQVSVEMAALFEANQRSVAEAAAASERFRTVLLRHVAMERDRRCALAYLHHRLLFLRRVRWELGTVLPASECESECWAPRDLASSTTVFPLTDMSDYERNSAF